MAVLQLKSQACATSKRESADQVFRGPYAGCWAARRLTLCSLLCPARLSAAGVAVWSLATALASNVTSFPQLLAARIGVAAAQTTQVRVH